MSVKLYVAFNPCIGGKSFDLAASVSHQEWLCHGPARVFGLKAMCLAAAAGLRRCQQRPR
jgi:hypothetical protein